MMEQSKEILLKRARAKFGSYKLAMKLLEANPESELNYSYGATTRCNRTLLQEGKKLSGRYCKNRWCFVCNRIRTGYLINGYEPVVKDLRDPYFVTLTKCTVSATKLESSINFMHESCRKIINSREGRRRKIRGIRKAECTIRPFGQYHYHFHFVIEGYDNAKWFHSQWLARMGSLASPKAQDVRPADDKSLSELFKYFTKLTVTTKDKEGKKIGKSLIDPKRMDVIFRSLRGRRVYQPFGGIRLLEEEIDDVQIQSYDFLDEDKVQVWRWKANDWMNDVGECLTGYKPSKKFEDFLDEEPQLKEIEQLKVF